MKTVFLGIGTNLGNRERNLFEAITAIEVHIGPVIKASSIYETGPWGFKAINEFLNMVVKVSTTLTPEELIDKILMIELLLGRRRGKKQFSSRIIDIDILFYDNVVINDQNLKIPHPLLQERRFVLVPLAEIDSELVHPIYNKSIAFLLISCKDKSMVRKFS